MRGEHAPAQPHQRGSRGTGRGRGQAVNPATSGAGHEPALCGAHKRDGGTCAAPAGRGTSHPGTGRCKHHGGSTRNHVAAADRQRVERQALAELARLGVQPVGDPLRALQELAGEVLAWKQLLAEHVAELQALRYSSDAGEQVRAEVVLFERAMDRAIQVLTAIARLNIDERLARVTEAQKLLVIRAIEAALAAAGVTGPAAVAAKAVVARHLRAVDGQPIDAGEPRSALDAEHPVSLAEHGSDVAVFAERMERRTPGPVAAAADVFTGQPVNTRGANTGLPTSRW